MDFSIPPEVVDIREAVRALCSRCTAEYWRELDATEGYPDDFVTALTDAGWLSAFITFTSKGMNDDSFREPHTRS